MQERKITLIDIGAGALPSVTQVAAQNTSWFPMVYVSPGTPPVEGVTPEPVADGVLIEWDAVDQAGVVYIIERGPSQNGPWTEIHRTTETRYLYSDGSGQKWFFRITASVRGKPGQGTVVEATPAPTTAELIAAQQKLDKEIVDRVLADGNEAASRVRDIALVNAGLVQEAQTRVTQIGQTMDAVAAESQTRATQLLNEKMERQAAITAVSETQQNGFDSLSRALSEVAAGSGTQFDSKTIWHFTTTVEGWGSNGGAPTLNDGWLRPTNNSASYAQSPAALGIDGNAYRFIKLRMRRTGNPIWLGLVRWTTEADQAWNDGKSTTIAPPAFDAAGVATVDISDIPWSGPSPIRQVRIALTRGQTVNDYVEYDYIAIGRPAPGASVALVQEETQARVTALAAEATQRNTLAVQMRGNYTGNDLSQAQGFVGDERTARVAADSAQVQRISTMEARMPAGAGPLATTATVTALQEAMVAADQANAQATTKVSSDLRAALSRSLNLVINGDLVNDLAGWQISGGQPGAWSVSATEGRGGGKCLKGASVPFGVVTSAQANLNEGIEVKVGRRYRLRAWVKVSADYVGDTDNSKIRVGAVRTDGTEVLLWSRTYNSGWTNWTLVEAVFTIAEGTARFRLSAGLRNTAGYVLVDDFELVDVTDEEQIAATASGLSSLTTRTGIIEGTQNAQATLIGQVQSGLTQTNGNVTAAQQAAQAAADAAGAKGKVIYGAAAPMVADRLPQNLWIDSTGNANTPKRWNGTAWAAVSDKVATDAAAAAAAAQQTANAAQSQASANAGALSTLDTKVTQQGAALTSLGQAITTVNAELDGLRTLGDNLIPNSNFSAGLQWWSLQTPFPVWSETAGDSRPGVTMTRTTSSNPALGAMDAQWIPNRGARRYRAIVRAMGVSGAMNLMLRLQRQNRETLAVGYSDKQLTLTSGFATYNVDFDAVDATIGSVRLWVYNYPNNAVVRVDSVELYDITDQLAAEANAAATSTLSGKVTSLEGTTTAQGEAITSVNAAIAATQAAGPNIVIDAGFEGFASEQIIHTLAAAGEFRAKAGNAGSSCFEGTRVGLLRRTVAPSTGNTDAYFGPSISVVTGRTYFIEAVVRNNSFFSGVAPGAAVFRFGLSVLTSGNARAWHAGVENRRLDALSQWTRVSAYVTVNTPNARSAQLWVSIPGSMPTGGLTDQNVGVLVDNVIWQDVTDAYGAKTTADAAATGLSALTTTVTQQGGQITALGQQVNQVGASVAGKADTQVVQTLTAMVKDTMTGGGNLLSNTLFKDGRRGWGWWNSGNGTWNELGLVAGPEWSPPGLAHFGGFAPSNLALNTQFWAGDEQPVPVVAGKRYCFSAYINCHRVGLALLISFRDANGNTVGEQYSGPADATNIRPPITLERLKRLSASMVAPASAVYARVGYYLRGLGLSNNEGNYFWIFQPMLEEMREGQTGPSPYSAGGGETLAGYSLYVTADGLTGGMVTKNDGKVVDMKILANVLQILSPNQPEGIEMRDGYIRVWKGNSQRIIGTGFGGGDLMDYFGPNVGAGAANKLNATMWMDVNGNAYWGGSLSAGIWKNANRTSSTAANPYVEVGPFVAHGKQRVVVASFSTFSPTYTTWYDGRSSSNEPPPPAIASSTVLRLRRNVGAGLELVSQQAFPASAVLVNLTYHDRDAGIRELPNGGWQQEYYFACSGSFTATEPGSTFQNFIYEGAITTQAIPQIVSQTIAVVSTEEP
ncbi:carbohydrate binding domain-containing protein [Stenotrophomonas sp. RG-453]|uniref:carbohydrate binding domain-containing protein n=1 Tax=Stenotrophomonas sp. RG-453 TaxID=2957502 RepID=UPI0029CA741D|nr:carbohydrate binding domain-containing protein [Stenotrophomonas sp. RG-453]MDX5516148.1 carbohydrate binding domain-containing protein [Stenotrophomonas sp. RG-453]